MSKDNQLKLNIKNKQSSYIVRKLNDEYTKMELETNINKPVNMTIG